ncbi:MAG: ADP-ribosylglycohydrolase family protein [Clostridia bacterium]|nr:ADP-ribosylglycohydrolase family protein [Clostridia bacterium]
MRPEFIEKIYAGWLAKMIGIRLGAPIEGWTYEKIRNAFGDLDHYLVDYRDFAADDDSNGPLFFLKALQDGRNGFDLKAQDVAEALLNYAPFEHGFFWWGGYGVSTEHTAYLNLRSGVPAPQSGSIAQNGATMAEQIGGQIFIDTWGLVTPGNPDLAAKFAKEAASVTHDGNGIYGGIFVAVCISYAFIEQDMKKILQKGLSYIPEDCEYARVVRAVMDFYEERPNDWRACFDYIFQNFGYDKYPGNCHIIPNIAVMILGLLYGEGDFDRTLNITNLCGWDTDCNVGNVATIMGVRNGLEGIAYDKWRAPINDFLACSSVVGSLNIMDIPYGAVYIAKLAYALAGETMPEPWNTIANERIDSCHFEFPGSTHAMRVRCRAYGKGRDNKETYICNTDETAATGERCLKVVAKEAVAGDDIFIYRKTFYEPADFHDSRYDPCFSPLIYPGQTLHASVFIPEYSFDTEVSLYVRDAHSGEVFNSQRAQAKKGAWMTLSCELPRLEGVLLDEMGVCCHVKGDYKMIATSATKYDYVCMIDDLYVDGGADYLLDFACEHEQKWMGHHREITPMTRLKGIQYLAEGKLHLSCSDFAESYTGRHDWTDYMATFCITPVTGKNHMALIRVQGAIRNYAFALLDGKAALLKNDNGYRVLAQADFSWELGETYEVTVAAKGNRIMAQIGDIALDYTDEERPYLCGSIGVGVQNGSHIAVSTIDVQKV